MKQVWRWRYTRLLVGLLFSGVTLYLALQGVSAWEVSRSVRQADGWWVLAAVGSVLVNTLAKGVRWYRLTGEAGREMGLWRVQAAYLSGQLLNLIYPARAGDVSRVLLVGKEANQKAYVFGSVLLEKMADLVSYGVLTVTLLVMLPLPGWLNRAAIGLAGLALVGLVGLTWMVSSDQRSERLGRWLANRNMRPLSESVWLRVVQLVQACLTAIGVVRQRRQALELAAWTGLVWATALLTNLAVMAGLQVEIEAAGGAVKASLLVLVALMVGIAVPAVPGRIGIFEYICVLTLGVFGIGQTEALTYGILLHAIVFLPVLGLGLVGLIRLSWKH